MKFEDAPEIKDRLKDIVIKLGFDHIDVSRLICFRSYGSKANVYARIWELPRVWQQALDLKPHYVIEVLNEHFDKQSLEEQDKILIHELLHIPYTFSGALRSHKTNHMEINDKTVEELHRKLKPNVWKSLIS